MEEYSFIAGFTRDPVAIAVEFPDLPGCLSCAENFRQAFKRAKEVLQLHLPGMIQDDEQIPQATDIENVSLAKEKSSCLSRRKFNRTRQNCPGF